MGGEEEAEGLDGLVLGGGLEEAGADAGDAFEVGEEGPGGGVVEEGEHFILSETEVRGDVGEGDIGAEEEGEEGVVDRGCWHCGG
ncbi:MAG: hypothetical protein KF678_11155 [Phycisphaeraceae bacterium]|nr:hypothetical protein [Phycisphaeraceae bacterium]